MSTIGTTREPSSISIAQLQAAVDGRVIGPDDAEYDAARPDVGDISMAGHIDRHRAVIVNVAAFFDGPDDQAVPEAWVAALAAELEQDDHGAYVNFIGDDGDARVRPRCPRRPGADGHARGERRQLSSTPAARASSASDARASSFRAVARSRPITRLTPTSR